MKSCTKCWNQQKNEEHATTKTLLVNCSLKNTVNKDLFAAINKFSEFKVVPYSEVSEDFCVDKDFDAIVISGSAARVVDQADRAKFKGVVHLVQTCKLPIFGICFGHQILCWALGAKVGSLPQGVLERFENIQVLDKDAIFAGFPDKQALLLAENHFDYVLKDSLEKAGFKLIADSASCEVEAVKHTSKPFYGVQFHPERTTIKNQTNPEGHKVIQNFFEKIAK